MKKNFFKKLSFVIALAMIISVVAPAAGAFAATKVKLNATKKYLHLGVDGKDEYNFNIVSKKGTGWKYSWESSNDDVVVVNKKNGVATAAGVGTAKVTVFIVDKDGEEVGEAKATVVVRDNIKEVSITNKPAGDKVSVGVAHDFNRSFVTFSGSKKVTSAITRWSVEPADGATIDDKGIFTATKAGEYTITAKTYQSKAKFEANEPLAATDSYKVTVPVEIKEVKQLNANKFVAEFNDDVSKTLTKDNAFVYQVINGKQVTTGTEKIKSVAFDGNKVTVELYGNIVSKGLYNFVYGDVTGAFTGANADVSEIAGIVFDDFTVATDFSAGGQNLWEKVSAVNADGVVIQTGEQIKDFLEFTYGGDYANGWIGDKVAFINKNGYSAVFTAKYTNFVLDSATNTYKPVSFEDQATGTGVAIAVNAGAMQFTVSKADIYDDPSKWPSTASLAIPAEDDVYSLWIRYKNNTDPSWADWTYADRDDFTLVSTDTDKLVIYNNYLYPAAQGIVTVLVKSGDTVVNTVDVTIMAKRSFASATLNTQMVSLGNFDLDADLGLVTFTHNEKKTVEVVLKDSMNEGISGASITNTTVTKAKTGDVAPTVSLLTEDANTAGKYYLDFTAAGADKGTYAFKFTISALNASKDVNVYVTVLDGESENAETDVRKWSLELGSGEVDLKKADDAVSVSAYVYGYNRFGARIYLLDGANYELEVKKANSAALAGVTDNSIPVATEVGGELDFIDLATYNVVAKATGDAATNPTKRAAGVGIDTKTLVVKDSTSLEVVIDKLSVSETSATTVDAAVRAAFNFKINGDSITETAGVFDIEYTKGGTVASDDGTGTSVEAGNSIFVKKVMYTTSWSAGAPTVTYTFNVNRTVTITK